MPLLLEDGEGEGRVPRGQGRAVVEARLRTQGEAIGQAVGADLDRACDEAVERVRLVERAHHQAVEGKIDPGRAVPAEDVGVERVEGVERLIAEGLDDLRREAAAARGHRVHVIEVREIACVFQLAEAR
jgi:hypothetical protein